MLLRTEMGVSQRTVKQPCIRFVRTPRTYIVAVCPLCTVRVSEITKQSATVTPRWSFTTLDNKT